jgi:hypothetical protein
MFKELLTEVWLEIQYREDIAALRTGFGTTPGTSPDKGNNDDLRFVNS